MAHNLDPHAIVVGRGQNVAHAWHRQDLHLPIEEETSEDSWWVWMLFGLACLASVGALSVAGWFCPKSVQWKVNVQRQIMQLAIADQEERLK